MRRFERADGALLTAALAMPAGMLLAGIRPMDAVVGAAGACIILYSIARLAGRVPADHRLPRWYGALRCAWCAVCGAWVLALTRRLFPQAAGSWFVPAVLAALAAWVCGQDAAAHRRAGAVLWPFVLAMEALVAAFALPEVALGDLAAPPRAGACACALALCLLPGMAPLRRAKGKMGGFFALACALCAAPGAICIGMLGRAQASASPFALYDAAKSISVFGVMERFEVLLSGALAVSAFCALSWLGRTGLDGLPGAHPREKAWALAAVSLALSAVVERLPVEFWVAGSAGCCGLAPLGVLLVAVRKKVAKKE